MITTISFIPHAPLQCDLDIYFPMKGRPIIFFSLNVSCP